MAHSVLAGYLPCKTGGYYRLAAIGMPVETAIAASYSRSAHQCPMQQMISATTGESLVPSCSL